MSTQTPTPTSQSPYPLEGGCVCGQVRYSLSRPLIAIHACHCHWCQRQSGSSYVLNGWIESSNVTLLTPTEPIKCSIPTPSGDVSDLYRCPKCFTATWMIDRDAYGLVMVIRVGTIDKSQLVRQPDAHIFVKEKAPWVTIGEGQKQFEEFYPNREEVWSKESLERWLALKPEFLKRKAAAEEQKAAK